MPAVVNYGGEGPLYSNLMDSSLFLSLGSRMDLYNPACKRSRISIPFVFKEAVPEQLNQCSLDDLPDECLFEIFRRLPGGQERSTCACVSKRWLMLQSSIQRAEICTASRLVNSLKLVGEFDSDKVDDASSKILKGAEDEMLFDTQDGEKEDASDGYLTRCLEGKKATDLRLAAIAVGTSSRGGLGKLMIRGSNLTRGATDVGLSAIARGCPSLRVLSLWNIPSIGDEGLCKIANGCRMLEKLDLSGCPLISDKGLLVIAKMCPNLASVTLESCSKVGNGSLQAIGQCCTNLKSIIVKDCPLVGDQGIASLVSSASSVLTKINLHALSITDASLAVIGHYGKAVTDLKLTGLHNVTERGFWVMGNALGLQKLKSLAITLCPGLTDLGLEAVGKGCPNLKQLCLRGCYLSDSGLKAFSKTAASLESLQLEECNRITQVGVVCALSNCGAKLRALTLVKCMGIRDDFSDLDVFPAGKSLRSLSIRNCSGFGSASLATVGKLCPHVQHVDLSGLSRVTDDGLLALLLSRESGLLKVNLSGCINLTDEAVSAMARLYGETLQLLNLDGCRNITDKSLIAIAKNCTSLYDLDLSMCAVTDLGVAALTRATQINLQILSLSGCSQVSDRSLLFLGELGQTLVGLNLQHCNLVSTGAGELLGEQLWRCDILS